MASWVFFSPQFLINHLQQRKNALELDSFFIPVYEQITPRCNSTEINKKAQCSSTEHKDWSPSTKSITIVNNNYIGRWAVLKEELQELLWIEKEQVQRLFPAVSGSFAVLT